MQEVLRALRLGRLRLDLGRDLDLAAFGGPGRGRGRRVRDRDADPRLRGAGVVADVAGAAGTHEMRVPLGRDDFTGSCPTD